MDVVSGFADLFEGRSDAFGAEHGECIRTTCVWSDIFRWHLNGSTPVGVYPMVAFDDDPTTGENTGNGWWVKWGCVDFDVRAPHKRAYDFETEADAHVAALNLVQALSHFGITGWIEVTKSRGRHVWVFAESWVPAATMRRALLVACAIAGVPPREVNPKSETLKSDQLGNYVRLPYPGALTNEPIETRWVYGGEPRSYDLVLKLESFVERALASRTNEDILAMVCELYVEPAKPRSTLADLDINTLATDVPRALTSRLSGLTFTIFRDGPLDGDRSNALFKLAALCAEDQLTLEEAYAVVADADARWGKYINEGREGLLVRTIERAYERHEALGGEDS